MSDKKMGFSPGSASLIIIRCIYHYYNAPRSANAPHLLRHFGDLESPRPAPIRSHGWLVRGLPRTESQKGPLPTARVRRHAQSFSPAADPAPADPAREGLAIHQGRILLSCEEGVANQQRHPA